MTLPKTKNKKSGDKEMEVVIDMREKKLYEICAKLVEKEERFKKCIHLSTEVLELGDICIRYQGNTELIIERKRLDDLLASIKDGRFTEQEFRLTNASNLSNHNIIYLIEYIASDIESYDSVRKQTIYSAMFSLNYYKGFSVWRSSDVTESAYMILNSAFKMNKEWIKKKAYYSATAAAATTTTTTMIVSIEEEKEAEEGKQLSYTSVLSKSKKNENITPNNFGEIVLMQIPSISHVTAIALMKKYISIQNLINELLLDPNCLDDFKYVSASNQKSRKISTTSISNIKKFLLPDL